MDNTFENYIPMKGYGIIYLYTLDNGRQYVGQTIRALATRHHAHIHQPNIIFDKALARHDFKLEVLGEFEYSELCDKETFYILKYNTLLPIGYNVTLGIESTSGYMKMWYMTHKHPLSEEVICLEMGKIYESANHASRDLNINNGDIRACCHKKVRTAGKYHWVYAKDVQSKSYDEIIEEIEKERILPGSKRVICLETGKIYSSASEASRQTGISSSGITGCCRGEDISANGTHWRFVDDCTTLNDYDIEYIESKRKANTKPRRIVCLETCEVFESISQASSKYGEGICACLKGWMLTAQGYHWCYYDDFTGDAESMIMEIEQHRPKNPKAREVMCLETGEIYDSISKTPNNNAVMNCLLKNTRNKTSGGYHWCYVDEYTGDAQRMIDDIEKSRTTPDKKIRCSNGMVFKSVKEASEWSGKSIHTIRAYLYGKCMDKSGLKWKYEDNNI